MEKDMALIQEMSNPNFYPHKPDSVEMVETHISWVFLAGHLVYKVKKPVDFGFLNYTTLELRHHFCNEEVRLNRRLCPDIYLGVVPICKQGDGFVLNGTGDPIEWAVEMRRMPDHGRMDRMIQADLIGDEDIKQLSEILIPFYQHARCSEEKAAEFGGISTVQENCHENFIQTEPFLHERNLLDQHTFDAIRSYTLQFIDNNHDLFERRQREKRIVEGHGDLYSANICIDRERDQIYVFDCIEFNERFRYGDQICDIAFLLMDLDFLGLPQLGAYMNQLTKDGLNENESDELVTFYKCYRAYVRGKIACFTWQGSDPQNIEFREQQTKLARRYFRLAKRYAELAQGNRSQPLLIIFMGLSGTGKSTLAEGFSRKNALPYYNSDRVRKEMIARIKATDSRLEPFGAGIYSQEFSTRTYRALLRLAGEHLVVGESVVLDATFCEGKHQKDAAELALASGAKLVLIHCSCPDTVVRGRFQKRFSQEERISDGRMEIYLKQKEIFSPPESATWPENVAVLTINTDNRVEDLLVDIEEKLNHLQVSSSDHI